MKLGIAVALTVLAASPLLAGDVTNPLELTRLKAVKQGASVVFTWDAIATDVSGQPETAGGYRVYQGAAANFDADKVGGTNKAGDTLGPASSLPVAGLLGDGQTWFFLASAYDAAGNEDNTRPSRVQTLPVLNAANGATTVDLTWTAALPGSAVSGYKVYYGTTPGVYSAVDVVGNVLVHSVSGLTPSTDYYFAVTAVDPVSNESPFSNEVTGKIASSTPLTVDLQAQDLSELCFIGGGTCAPKGNEIQRDSGREILVPVDFPTRQWVKATMTVTVDSGLCGPPIANNKCGGTNTGSVHGWNPCGDPWDRTVSVFLVLNSCVAGSGRCFATPGNVELLQATTPFGTDSVTGARVWNYDVTPLAPLLVGQRYIGINISTWVANGWTTSVVFHMSDDPANASPKLPAAGLQPVFFDDGGNITTPVTVAVPATATKTMVRYFVTGHGGNAGNPTCANQPADEFCHRDNQILVNGSPGFQVTPWVSCCFGTPTACTGCTAWNACGYPSCKYDRAGWCPGFISCHTSIMGGCDQDIDATSWLPPGGSYDLTYNVVGINGSWTKSLIVYWY